MNARKSFLLIYTAQEPGPQSLAMYRDQLVVALRAHGAQVEELELERDANALLDRLEAGAVPVVLKARC